MYLNVLIQAQKKPLKKDIPLSTKDEDVSGTLHWTYKSNKRRTKGVRGRTRMGGMRGEKEMSVRIAD